MTKLARIGVVAAAATLAVGASANAGVIYTTSGTSASYAVTATADITLGNGTINIVLTNTTPFTHDAGQLLTDFHLTINDFSSTPSLTSSLAIPRTVASNGSFVDGALTSTNWGGNYNAGSHTETLVFNGSGAKYAILGPDSGGDYSGANGSITVSPGHNPFAAEQVTFTLNAPGVTANSAIQDVQFSWNTGLSYLTPGTPIPNSGDTPEPASLGLLGLGAVGLLARRRRR